MRLSKYDFAAPRYTSFPTAVQFQNNIEDELVTSRLHTLTKDEAISLYTHIPFCHQLCHYCGCHTTITPNYDRVASYIDLLLQEIEMVGKHVPKGTKVNRLHFGGGSPNYATNDDLGRIMDAYSKVLDLDDAQLDMECDPRLLDDDKITGLAALGLSRISLGVQDFNPDVQKAINREQSYDMIAHIVDRLRTVGIDAINFDLMTGLPAQSIQTVDDTITQVLTLMPSRIAVFPYAHVPWMKKHQSLLERHPMPNTEQRFEMTNHMHDRLVAAGYVPIGIDHYALSNDSLAIAAKKKVMQRNFQGYTDDPSDVILGFGLSSISQFKDAYTQNSADLGAYRGMMQNQLIPVARGITLSPNDMARRKLINDLMCYFGVIFADHPEVNIPYTALKPLEHDGIIRRNEHGLRITEQGRPFTRIVASCFDPYFQPDAGRHAKAI